MIKMAKKTLSERVISVASAGKRGRKKDSDDADGFPELSRCNSYDFDAGVVAGGGGPAGAAAAAAAAAADGGLGGAGGGGGGAGSRDSDTLCLRERHLVPVESIRVGMSRFSFLLETCAPGSVPDPLLIAALLDLVGPRELHSLIQFLPFSANRV